MNKQKIKQNAKKVWHFIWESDSIWSWIVNVILAFIIIKFLVYPALGAMLNTTHPIVAVVSGSMEHKIAADGFGRYSLCDKFYSESKNINFDEYWQACGNWYLLNTNISKLDFQKFPLNDGFDKGDIMVIYKTNPEKLKVGDTIVFQSYRPDPIIHRIINIWNEDGAYYIQTKGDHNSISFEFESKISETAYIGKAVFRIPYLGYIKIWFVELISILNSVIAG